MFILQVPSDYKSGSIKPSIPQKFQMFQNYRAVHMVLVDTERREVHCELFRHLVPNMAAFVFFFSHLTKMTALESPLSNLLHPGLQIV